MADEAPNAMNLDLNLLPNDNSSNDLDPEVGLSGHEDMNLEELLGGPVNRIREVIRQSRRRRLGPVLRQFQDSPGTRNLALRLNDGDGLHLGEGSIASEERPSNGTKTCDNNDVILDHVLGKDNEEKGTADTGSFFDCNICLDMANDPVVTCCGHLFCWPCLYRWLHLHSEAKECPLCKGEVTLKSVTPIYGRGENVRRPVDDINLKIPLRPQARKVENSRQPFQGFDNSQVQPQDVDAPREPPVRNVRLLAARARRERMAAISLENMLDESTPSNPDWAISYSTFAHHINDNNAIETYIQSDSTVERNQDRAQAVDDRDSVSSIAAIIQSDSRTVDATFSTSSSRRRNNVSRVSDVDSGDSLRLRRRRLN